MRKYIKPSIKFVELRIEESMAGLGSLSTLLRNGNSVVNLISSNEDWQSFWLRILRK